MWEEQGLKVLAALGRTDVLWCILCACELNIHDCEPATDIFSWGYGQGMDWGGGGGVLVGGVRGLGWEVMGLGRGVLGLGWSGRG